MAHYYWRRWQRRAAAALTLAAVVACAVGVPLPAGVAKRSAAAFPCQDCPCGCVDAEQCWRDCCCYTNVQKLDWAARHGVKPPKFVMTAARREATHAAVQRPCCRQTAAAAPAAACCKRPSSAELASSKPGGCNAATCGSESKGEDASDHDAVAGADGDGESKVVLLVSALRCRGISASAALLPPSLPLNAADPPPELVLSHEAPAEELLLYRSPAHAVATPPPDACA